MVDRFVTVDLDESDWASMVRKIREVATRYEDLNSSTLPPLPTAGDPMEINTVSSKSWVSQFLQKVEESFCIDCPALVQWEHSLVPWFWGGTTVLVSLFVLGACK